MRFGYAAINLTLSEKNVRVNRSMIRRIFLAKGLAYASELALANVTDLETLIDWNGRNGIQLYRMSSDMMPWMSEYELPDLPDYEAIRVILARCGKKVAKAGMRLSFHPGPFNVLATRNESVLTKTIKELRQHGEIMDLLELPATPFAKINIHVGGAFGDKTSALARFAESYAALPDTARLRLSVENDDKVNMFSVRDLLWLNGQVGIPVTFDYFHHTFCTGGLDEQEALLAATGTWPAGITPVVHFSSSRRVWEDPAALQTAHADFVYQPVNVYGQEIDIMFEAKAKEKAVKKYLRQFKTPVL